MSFKTKLNKRITASGRSRVWISAKLKMDRTTFWRKANGDTFTKEEKEKIEQLLN